MLIPMLKATIQMLDGCNKDKVECAKSILQELVIELEKEPKKKVYYVGPGSSASLGVVDEELDPEAIAAKEELIG